MAQDAISYIKSVWNKITGSSANKQAKDDGMKELEDYLNSLTNLDGKPVKPTLPDPPDFDRIEYDAPTDEDIKNNAESDLGEYKNNTISGIEDEINSLKEKYESDKENSKISLDKKNEAVEQAYGDAKKNNDNDMLKRGIARSSIAVNKNTELEGAQAKMKTDAYNEYASDIKNITGDIDGLETKRIKALNDFNISYAAKLTKSINELKAQRDAKVTEALKYNNSMSEKEYNASIDKTMKESDLYGDSLSQREKEEKLGIGKTASKEVYNKMATVLRNMNPLDAQEMLANNKIFRANLDDYHYYLLYDEFIR